MTEYLEIEDEEIIYHVYNLNWLLPENIQQRSMETLNQLSPDKVDLVIPKYNQNCWHNAVSVLKQIGYPRNKKALPKLARLLQDRNWPGSLEAIEIFRDLGKKISVSYIERECEEALKEKDYCWLEHLEYASDSLNIGKEDFNKLASFE
ncbi:hypothetical protein ABEV54_17005 [Peribacillus psychrosaccharolyticus]|uniref:hypothetical protein n=2 Tax=Peribacillus psychrosaccharolyticus TaxID=1407 RepID=UPI003D2D5907